VAAARVAEGVYACALTPRRRGLEEIDLSALWELLDFLCSKKVGGIVLMGRAGEAIHFTVDERVRMMGLAVRRSRVPVLIDVSHSALDCALQLGESAIRSGAAGLLLGPPWSCGYDQSDLVAFYSVFHEQLAKHVPLYISNLSELEPDAAVQLLAAGYTGVADASGDWSWFEAVRSRAAGKQVLIADDALYVQARISGAPAAVSAAACAVPELMLALDRAIDNTALAGRLDEFVTRARPFPVPTAIREAVAVRGLKTGQPAAPLEASKMRALGEFREWFKGWLPQVQKEVQQAAAHA
jgi:dihydrodipicolinate synthase/N-acetylneuraminate lyase